MKKNSSKSCEMCKKPSQYNERYDAYYCSDCEKWLEQECGDSKCFYCAKRPDKPKDKNLKKGRK
jgi:hypothetical protein